ncbi:MAG: DNA-processing protein DprA [Chloroflexi bacterium]|nr:DNA-processing protein DprA [Chloroflexota bacterium]
MTGTGVMHVHVSDTCYLNSLTQHLENEAPETVAVLGNPEILWGRKLAILCSSRCPGSLILQTHQLIQTLRQSAVTVVSGFHSPVEQECFTLLLRHVKSIVYCLARALDGMRIPRECREPLEERRLVFLSPFLEKPRRATAETAFYRNRFVAALADVVLVLHAEPGGKTEHLCREVLSWGKSLFTLSSDHNENLVALGARAVSPDTIGVVMEAVH